MTPNRRATDRAAEHTPPWWVSLVLIGLMLAPVAVALTIGAHP